MENAQLISLSRQIALQRQMDVVANNMANINTNGFKSEDMLFQDYIMPKAKDNDFGGQDSKLHYTEDWSTLHNMETGPIEQTGNPLDVALQGEGFLSVQTPQGVRYTRNGTLTIDNQGMLVDLDGNQVLGDGGPIKFDSSDTDISIAKNGAISTSNGSKGKLAVVEFANPQVLAKQGDNYFSGPAGTPATSTDVIQGSIEKSNVSGVAEISRLIEISRAYAQVAQMLSNESDLHKNAISQLANVPS